MKVAPLAVSAGDLAVVQPALDDDGPKVPKDRRGGLVAEGTPDGFTDKQWAFVRAYTDGKTAGIGLQSALAAGYGTKNPGTIAADLLKLPHIIEAIDAQLREAISVRLTVKAVRVIEGILDSSTASEKLKADMAAKVIDFGGVALRAQAQKTKETGLGGDKPIGELSRKEIEEIVRKGAGILAAAASLPPAGAIIEGRNALISDPPEDINEE